MKRKFDHGKIFNEAGHLTQEALGWLREGPLPAMVEKHLEDCELCRDALEGFRSGEETIPHAEMVRSMRHQLEKGAFRRIQLTRTRRRVRRTGYWPVYLAAAASVLALVGYFAFLPAFRQPASPVLADHPGTTREEQPVTPLQQEAEIPAEKEREKAGIPSTLPAPEPELPVLADAEEVEETKTEILAERSTEILKDMDDTLLPVEDDLRIAAAADRAEPEGRALEKSAPAAAKRTETTAGASANRRRTVQDTLQFLIDSLRIVTPPEDTRFIRSGQDIALPVFSRHGYEHFFDYLYSTLNVPVRARRRWVSGTVYVGFTIHGDGSVREAEILRGIDPAVDEEALRVVSLSPPWEPGRINGRPVKVKVTVPVRFDE